VVLIDNQDAQCGLCRLKGDEKICKTQEGKGPQFCPTINKQKIIQKVLAEYERLAINKFAREAALQEAECYLNRDHKPFIRHTEKPRIEEIVEFARRMGYKRLGLAFCSGLQSEGNITTQILQQQGFVIISVACKVGAIPKEKIGVKDDQKVSIESFEPMCNPIAQAEILNEAETEFNIMLGLCVGHDSLFFKYAKAPTTVFAVKDRVFGHNPLAAIYTCNSYYEWLMKTEMKPELD
jgi:uncharacterized metal-binding protein